MEKHNIDYIEKRKVNHIEKETRLSTDFLTHFTDEFENLLSILKLGFKPSFSTEYPMHLKEYFELTKIGEILGDNVKIINNIDIPMVCFCDIPLKLSQKHRTEYGNYGISLKKSWAISKLISPVTYIVENSKNHSLIYSIHNQFEIHKLELQKIENYKSSNLEYLDRQISALWGYMKQYYNYEKEVKYYDEREWRYIANNYSKHDVNNTDKYLKFNLSDLSYIIVLDIQQKRKVVDLLKNIYGVNLSKIVKIMEI